VLSFELLGIDSCFLCVFFFQDHFGFCSNPLKERIHKRKHKRKSHNRQVRTRELILQGTFRNENLLQERKKQQKGKEEKIQYKFKPLLDAQSL
jgi:hypothetical protein